MPDAKFKHKVGKKMHTFADFDLVEEFHGAEGTDRYTYECRECHKKVSRYLS